MSKQHGNTEGRSVEEVNAERGADYGTPTEHFNCTQQMYLVWQDRRNSVVSSKGTTGDKLERVLRHCVYMILDKLARLATNPLLMDGWSDIKGYARCFELSKQELHKGAEVLGLYCVNDTNAQYLLHGITYAEYEESQDGTAYWVSTPQGKVYANKDRFKVVPLVP